MTDRVAMTPQELREIGERTHRMAPFSNREHVMYDDVERLLAYVRHLESEREKLESLLYDCILELSYVQSVENCTSLLCASSNGRDLVDRGMAELKLAGLWENTLKNTRAYEEKHNIVKAGGTR